MPVAEEEVQLSLSPAATTLFGILEKLLSLLPSDPFEQLDVARKITSIALSARISALESEACALRDALAEKDDIIADLTSQVESLDASLSDASDRASQRVLLHG